MKTKVSVVLCSIFLLLSIAVSTHAQAPKVLKVKGIYLGMDFKKAQEVLKSNLPQEIKKNVKFSELGPDSVMVMGANYAMLGSMTAESGTNKLDFFGFDRKLVDVLFNAQGMPVQEFASNFISAYGIGKMVTFREEKTSGWRFVSKHGYLVDITTKGELMIKKTATAGQLNFN